MKPTTRPRNPNFSSGPCAKRPGWSVTALKDALTGRSHRAKIGKVEVITSFFLKARDPADAAGVSDQVKAYLGEKITEPQGFYVESPSSLSKMFDKVTGTLNLVLAGIAAISLLVGGIGIMNIMLVSVTERTREIGIRKALGAPARMIRQQFLTESAALTVLGGIQGALIGFGLGKLVTHLLGWPFSPDIRAFVLAIGFSIAIGLFFGIYPAIRASRLNPIEALSHE